MAVGRVTKALDAGDPDAVSFDAKLCGSCNFRDAIPEAGHPGCTIGEAVVTMSGAGEPDE